MHDMLVGFYLFGIDFRSAFLKVEHPYIYSLPT